MHQQITENKQGKFAGFYEKPEMLSGNSGNMHLKQ